MIILQKSTLTDWKSFLRINTDESLFFIKTRRQKYRTHQEAFQYLQLHAMPD
jgi:hypothetical protein